MLILPLDSIKLLLQCILERNSPAEFLSMDSDVKSIDYLNHHSASHIHVCTTTHTGSDTLGTLNSIYLIDISTLLVLDHLIVCRNKQLHLGSTWFNSIYLDTWNKGYEIPIYCYVLSKIDSKKKPAKCFYSFHTSHNILD